MAHTEEQIKCAVIDPMNCDYVTFHTFFHPSFGRVRGECEPRPRRRELPRRNVSVSLLLASTTVLFWRNEPRSRRAACSQRSRTRLSSELGVVHLLRLLLSNSFYVIPEFDDEAIRNLQLQFVAFDLFMKELWPLENFDRSLKREMY